MATCLATTPVSAGTFRIVAERGDIAPGAGGATYDALYRPRINVHGEVAFTGRLTGADVDPDNDEAHFTTSSGLIAREGDVAPGSGGQTIRRLGAQIINDHGEVAYSARIAPVGVSANVTAILTSTEGLVLEEGDLSPGADPQTIRSIGVSSLTNDGTLGFAADVSRRSFDARRSVGFTSDGAVAREGDSVPGLPGMRFETLGGPVLSENGEIAFAARIDGYGVTRDNDSVLIGPDGLIVREADPAPGTGGANFGHLTTWAFSDAGEAAFLTTLRGEERLDDRGEAIFSSVSGLVVREGDIARGTGGARFEDFGILGPIALNNMGVLAFNGNLVGPHVIDTNDRGLFTAIGPAAPILVAREGDTLDFGNGDMRTLTSLVLGARGVNDAGQLAFSASFADGSRAIVIAEDFLAPVPLPAPLLLLGAGLLGLGLLRRSGAGRA